MVVQKDMDVNQEAQDYLKQFNVPKTRPTQSIDSSLESMFDTWTREKYRLKTSRKGSNHLPKEWDKVPSALSTGLLGYDSNLEDLTDNLLNNSLEDQQDTYMNEEAFLEQLLHQDTIPQKPTRRKQELTPHRSPKQNKLSHKQPHIKKSSAFDHYDTPTPPTSHGSPRGNGAKHLVEGQLVSNESKQAVLRRGVCQDEEVLNISPRHHHQSKIKHQQPVDLLPSVENVQNYQPQTVSLHPICQKCGWTLTSSTGEVIELPEILEMMGPRSGVVRHGNVDMYGGVAAVAPQVPLLNISASSATTTSSLKHSPRQQLPPPPPPPQTSHHHHSPRNRKTSQESLHSPPPIPKHHPHQHHQGGGGSSSLKLSPRSNNSNSNPILNISRSLTTSIHCHNRASQTDPNLLNQDLSPVAEIDTYNRNNTNPTGINNSSGSGSRQKGFSRGKPPSGRLVKPDVLGGNVDIGCDQIPVVEAAKGGNVQLLQDLLTVEPEQAKYHDVQGNNLLHITSERGHLPCVQYLTNVYPQYCEQENKAKFTPAALTVKAGHVDVLDWLLENTCAKDEILPLHSKKSLLHHAAKFGQDGCLRVVLEKMTAMDRNNSCCDSNGNSPAHVAAKHGHLLCLQSLVEYGVDVTKANKYGHSPCYYADFSNHKLCASYLMVVETCLNLAKKLIRLEKSMEQLSNSLAKYSDNTGEVNLTYDYNGDRSSATSSVEDDGTRDEAWQLLCRKFEEASKRLVVFRTQNRAVRPLRPTKLALLALAQTKEETQAAMSVINTVKTTSSTNDLASDVTDTTNRLQDNRSKSVPDLPSTVREDQINSDSIQISSSAFGGGLNKVTGSPSSSLTKTKKTESTFVVTGIPSHTRQKTTIVDNRTIGPFTQNLLDTSAFTQSKCFDNITAEYKETSKSSQVFHSKHKSELVKDSVQESKISTDNNSKSDTLKNAGSKPVKPPRREHKRSSSVGDIIDSDITLNNMSDDIEYHLKTRVLPPSPILHPRHKQQPPQESPPPPPLPPRQHLINRQPLLSRGAQALPLPPTSGGACGENEQTSDFFEEMNGKHDSDTSEMDPRTLQKLLDMQEEIMRCDPSYIPEYPGSRIRTPVKLELTPEDFNETYARKPPMDDDVEFPYPPFRFKRGPPVRMRYGDHMNKSGNNSHTDTLEDIMENEYHTEKNDVGEILSEGSEEKPWYEMSEDEERKEGTDADEFFTLL